jgi:hypothetical protein
MLLQGLRVLPMLQPVLLVLLVLLVRMPVPLALPVLVYLRPDQLELAWWTLGWS